MYPAKPVFAGLLVFRGDSRSNKRLCYNPPPDLEPVTSSEQGRRRLKGAAAVKDTGTVATLWDANDVARHLKCSRQTVYRKAEAGQLPCLRVFGSLLRFEPAAILDILKTGKKKV